MRDKSGYRSTAIHLLLILKYNMTYITRHITLYNNMLHIVHICQIFSTIYLQVTAKKGTKNNWTCAFKLNNKKQKCKQTSNNILVNFWKGWITFGRKFRLTGTSLVNHRWCQKSKGIFCTVLEYSQHDLDTPDKHSQMHALWQNKKSSVTVSKNLVRWNQT